ncbi:MAG: PepSY domain-containing protein [Nitrospinae bacterium]|nr:PepSY domain-containing protein [Nitrospinota bacterium]
MKRVLPIITSVTLIILFSAISYGDERMRKNITLDGATAIAVKEAAGEVVKIKFEKGCYKFKVRTNDGRYEYIYIHAADGSVIKKGEMVSDKKGEE